MSTARKAGSYDGGEEAPGTDRRPFFVRVKAHLAKARDRVFANRLDRIDPEYVEEWARQVSGADLDAVVERAEAIERRFRGDGPLGRLIEDGRLLLGLVRDARRGRYRDVPVWTLSAAGFALLYVLNPFELIPDALPVLGLFRACGAGPLRLPGVAGRAPGRGRRENVGITAPRILLLILLVPRLHQQRPTHLLPTAWIRPWSRASGSRTRRNSPTPSPTASGWS